MLLDIPRPRRPGDEIDRTRHSVTLAQPCPAILVGGDHLIAPHYYDMGVGQEIQRRRGLDAGDQHQCSGLGDRGEAGCKADRIACLCPAAADAQQRSSTPRDLIKARVGCHHEIGGKVLGGEIVGDCVGNGSQRADSLGRRLNLLGHRDKQINPAPTVERRRPRRNQIALMRRNPFAQLPFARGVEPATL